MEWTFSTEKINDVAKSFWDAVGSRKVIAFHGEMGAGKTTFIHALCDVKGVKDVVGSPTFSIINEYIANGENGSQKIYHIDLYRLKDEEEAIQAGVEDCLYSDHICLVEWPDKAAALFPPETLHAYIEPVGMRIRKLKIGNN